MLRDQLLVTKACTFPLPVSLLSIHSLFSHSISLSPLISIFIPPPFFGPIFVCLIVFLSFFVCMCTSVRACLDIFVRILTCTSMCTYNNVCVCVNASIIYMCTSVYVFMDICPSVSVSICICLCIYISVCTWPIVKVYVLLSRQG